MSHQPDQTRGHAGRSAQARLIDPVTGKTFGYRFGGVRPGPVLVAMGSDDLVAHVAARLGRIPSLPWLRGTLCLLRADRANARAIESTLADSLGTVDRVVHLPFADDAGPRAVREATWKILREAAVLGMIQGRGVRLCRHGQQPPSRS
ncbi:hypothetical protein LV82_01481 [Albidovulum inexpectatum]|uniref:Uncharacterized protein n=2 Tax=Albidovulum inexpectatum TaxID=196587 RepID=A0A2S5JH54_9RHOB|nr:hypothetical protein LV82_01481 [Albidovulum inexpectatum]